MSPLPQSFTPIWINKVRPAVNTNGLGEMVDNAKEVVSEIKVGVAVFSEQRKQVINKAKGWYKDVKSDADSVVNKFTELKNTITGYSNEAQTKINSVAGIAGASNIIGNFSAGIKSMEALFTATIEGIPNIQKDVVNEAKSMFNNVSEFITNGAKELQTNISQLSQNTANLDDITNMINTYLTGVYSQIGGLRVAITEIPGLDTSQLLAFENIGESFAMVSETSGAVLGQGAQETVEVVKENNPIRLLYLEPITGGLKDLLEAVIEALEEKDNAPEVEA